MKTSHLGVRSPSFFQLRSWVPSVGAGRQIRAMQRPRNDKDFLQTTRSHEKDVKQSILYSSQRNQPPWFYRTLRQYISAVEVTQSVALCYSRSSKLIVMPMNFTTNPPFLSSLQFWVGEHGINLCPWRRSCQIASHLNPVKIKILISSKSSIKGDVLYISGTKKRR